MADSGVTERTENRQNKLRVVGWEVRLIAMSDDGDTLEPVNVQPAQILARQWEEFKNGGDDEAIAQVQAQINPA